jgi:protein-disulfide isomerase
MDNITTNIFLGIIVLLLAAGIFLLYDMDVKISNTAIKPVLQPTGGTPTGDTNVGVGNNGPSATTMQDDDPVRGDVDAPVTIVEFSDFQCPFCARFFENTLPQLEENYIKTGKVKLIYRDFPLDQIHKMAGKAAEASECADEQNKYWEYHNILFSKQNEWANYGIPKLKDYAIQLGLNATQFDQCLDSEKYFNEVANDAQSAESYGVTGTPTFFIGTQKFIGAQSYETFKQAIDAELGKN